MTHRCHRGLHGQTMFSIKTGTVVQVSKVKYRIRAIANYLFVTNIKSISSMYLHRELNIGQKSTWFQLHRLRKAFNSDQGTVFRAS